MIYLMDERRVYAFERKKLNTFCELYDTDKRALRDYITPDSNRVNHPVFELINASDYRAHPYKFEIGIRSSDG